MAEATADLIARVAGQTTMIPSVYGRVDFGVTPERFTEALEDGEDLLGGAPSLRSKVLGDRELVERFRVYAMLGDNVADAYAALIPQYGFRGLIKMLTDACERGVESVEAAPPELVAFIRAMEHTPEWVDMALVEEGGRLERNSVVHASRFAMRGSFIATFINKYQALPMALTGALSNETARRRVVETASFFITTYMPGALTRFGPGFKAAAMVRLMHAMVRFNALRNRDAWDVGVYGIPIPQVDQMSAGLLSSLRLAQKALASGRTTFNPTERACVELARYRCHLLGLPEDLAPGSPAGLVEAMSARQATLRRGYDDATCGELVRATLAANLASDDSLRSRVINSMERGFSKLVFVKTFMHGDMQRAARIGVKMTLIDHASATVIGLMILIQISAYDFAARVPGLRKLVERRIVSKMGKLLRRYGHAEFATDADAYRPALPKHAAA
jgi:hypothetical protein